MQFTDQISMVNHLTTAEEVAVYFKAFRKDEIIWSEVQRFLADSSRVEYLAAQERTLDAGVLCLLSIDPAIDLSHYPKISFSGQALERIMFAFETYIQSDEPVDEFLNAALLAAALIEKRKVTSQWKNVILEILSRMKINTAEKFNLFWGTIFAITVNLAEERNELLTDLLALQQQELGLGVFVHSVLCLPVDREQKNDLFSNHLQSVNTASQSLALRQMSETTDPELVRSVALRLLEKYARIETDEQPYDNYWKNPASSLQFALQCQSIADIANYAGDTLLAIRLINKSMEIMAAVESIGKMKKAALNPDPMDIHEIFTESELARPEIVSELVYSTSCGKVEISPDQAVFPVKIVRQSKEISQAGNSELAYVDLIETVNKLSDNELDELFVKGPRFIPTWDVIEVLENLISSNADQEAGRVARILLQKNPFNKRANFAAARVLEKTGNWVEALNHWQTLAILDPQSVEIKRNLGKAYLITGNKTEAFTVLNDLVSDEESAQESDLLEFANLALDLGRTDDVFRAVEKILVQESEHAEALTLAGLAHCQNGETEKAVENLQKAVEIPGDDSRAWIALSEIYGKNGNKDAAMNVLKEGLAANPDETLIKSAYAKNLVQNGSAAEAYPLLRELSTTSVDYDTDILLVDIMKQLGKEDLSFVIEEMKERYPEDTRVLADYGENLVANGKLADGLNILRGVKTDIKDNSAWSMAYVTALLGVDYSRLHNIRKISVTDIDEAIGMVDQVMTTEPDQIQARLLKGELLAQNNQHEAAVKVFAQALESKNMLDDRWLARLHADLAQSTTALGKVEVALASIEEAVSLQQDWVGLQQVKTAVLISSGDACKAEEQLKHIREIAPDSIEKSIWETQIWLKLGNLAKAASVLQDAISKYPACLELQTMAVEMQLRTNVENPSDDLVQSMKTLVMESTDPQELIHSAVVFANMGKVEEAITALNRGSELGSVEASINLCGFYRTQNESVKAGELLNQIKGIGSRLSIFKAEVEFNDGNIENAYEILRNTADTPIEVEFESAFLPVEWRDIVNSSKPATALWLMIGLKSGNHCDSMTRAREWITAEPHNLEAYVYGIEMALACGAFDDYDHFLDMSGYSEESPFFHNFELLRIERDQERGIFALSAEEATGDSTTDLATKPEVIARVRALAAEGQLYEAETLLEEIVQNFSRLQNLPYICRTGLLRNAIKAGVAVNRWKEAVNLYRQYGKEMEDNNGLKSLFLETLVTGIEFFNSVQGLSIDIHLPWNALFVAALEDEISKLSEALLEDRFNDAQRWVLRGNLALNPSQENIRALALLTPQADDAAALMAGLRAADQLSTAIQVAKKFGNNSRVLFELALCLSEKDGEKAAEVLKSSLQIFPDQPTALCLLSRIYENLGRRPEALEKLEEAISLWPNEARWHMKAAEILHELGNLDEPVRHLQAALELNPNDTEIIYQLGSAYALNRNHKAALEYLQAAASKAPNRAEIWEAISEAYQQAGDLSQALEAAEKASKTDPFAVKPHLQAGRVNWSRGEVEKALEQIKMAISLKPDNAEGYVFLAQLLQEKGEKAKALETLEKASHCKVMNVNTMIDHAALLKEINGTAAARDLLAVFSQRFPENPKLLKMLAEAEEECGELKKAEAAAKRALEFHPEETDLHLFLGNLQEKSGNLDQAAHYFSQAIAHDPEDTEGYIKLSHAFAQQREFAKARDVLEEGIRRAPEDINLYLACASLLKDAKDYRGAEQMLRKASAIDPRNLAVHRQLGAVLALNLVHQSQEVSSHL